MSRTTLTLMLVVGFLAALSSWLSREDDTGPLAPAAPLPHIPDYYISGFSAASYTAAGLPRNRLSAEQMTHYADDHSTELLKPQLIFVNEQGEAWQLRAGKGSMDNVSDLLLLSETVVVRRQSGDEAVELRTEAMTVRPSEQLATTRTPVTITAPHARIDAAGLEAHIAEERLVLYSVRGHYEP